jgi:hypothetical protein
VPELWKNHTLPSSAPSSCIPYESRIIYLINYIGTAKVSSLSLIAFTIDIS